jgi:signal transduction protein with GAF and PtsI domain
MRCLLNSIVIPYMSDRTSQGEVEEQQRKRYSSSRRVKDPYSYCEEASKTRDDLCDHIAEGEPDEAIITEGFFDDEMARATSMRDEYVREYAKHSSLRAHFCSCRL